MNTEEDFEIKKEITETTTIMQNPIKSETVEISLLNQNESTILIGPLNGWIEGYMYETNNPVEVRMFLDDIPEKSIVYHVSLQGRDFTILRKIAQDGVGDQFNYVAEKIPIDGHLGIQIKGAKGTKAKFKILYS
jgi:hypothetical protein